MNEKVFFFFILLFMSVAGLSFLLLKFYAFTTRLTKIVPEHSLLLLFFCY